jgi:hypothetical protein
MKILSVSLDRYLSLWLHFSGDGLSNEDVSDRAAGASLMGIMHVPDIALDWRECR